MAGLKTLAKELQSKGRNGETILAHINPQEAGILKALGGSGTINPDTGLPEYFKIGNPFKPVQRAIGQLNPLNPGSGISKTIDSIPVVGEANRAINKLGTQVFQPLEKAIVQPVSRGLASFDKAVGNTIPGGWGTVGSIALSAMGAPMPLQIGYGAARGSGVMRKGGNFNLQGAVIGGATAYATAELGDYMRGASDSAIEAGKEGLTEAVAREAAPITDYSQSIVDGVRVTPPPPSVGDFAGSLSDPTAGMAQAYTPPLPPPSAIQNAAKFITEIPTTGVSTAGDTLSGIKNLTGFGSVTAKEAAAQAAKTGIKALPMAGLALYGETSLAGLDEQRKYLEESKRANAISQAEYDAALGEINRQRDYAADVVSRNQFNPNPNRDVSIGDTFYGRTGGDENFYARTLDPTSSLYAMGGQVDDELGGDYSAMGMDQGNLQKGLFGMGYAAGGQIDMGNGYNPFTNLPPMSGPLGAVGQQTTPFSPERMSPQIREMIRVSGGGRDEQGRTVDGLGNVVERTAPSGQSFGQIMGGLSSILNQSTPQVSPSLNQNPNTNMGGFAGPSSFYGGGGGFGGGGSGLVVLFH